jgi:hypothetical protein
MDALSGIVTGAVAGAVYGITAYFKSPENAEDGFDVKKLAPAVAIGAIAGAYSSVSGVPMDEASVFVSSMTVSVLVENVWKAVYRRLSG